MGIRTLIFDWDGTLHDTKALYGASLRGTLRWLISQGYPVPENQSDEYLSRYLGVNARDMWMDYMPELPLEVREECSRRTGEQMVKEINAGNAKLYPGTLPVLSALKDSGYRLVILSNCKVPYMEAQRKAFELDARIESYFCSGAYGFRPKEEIFPDVAKNFPGEYCMIGDRASDRKVAEVHGIHFIGCSYGFGRLEEISGGDGVIQDIEELPEVLRRIQA